jgi:hypothetical protein
MIQGFPTFSFDFREAAPDFSGPSAFCFWSSLPSPADICVFFHPDFTVGTGFTPVLLLSQLADFSPVPLHPPRHLCPEFAGIRKLHRQWGISPRPEDLYLFFACMARLHDSPCVMKLQEISVFRFRFFPLPEIFAKITSFFPACSPAVPLFF